MQLTPEPFAAADLPVFFDMARQEGWICDPWEFEFLLREPTADCLVVRSSGEVAACITAIAYGRQGWIGNLIVRPDMRRQGLGRRLMDAVLARLQAAGTKSVWLTASPTGAPLYESLGFVARDCIVRRVGAGRSGIWSEDRPLLTDLVSLDAAGWGGGRITLLVEKALLGQIFQSADGFLAGHCTPSGYQLGPGGGEPEALPELLDRALAAAGTGRVFIDLPAGNAGAGEVLEGRGFSCCGEALLMCRGDASGYHADRIWALGSMGSIG